ncbi:PaaI family thioesterase [Streptomyces chiangmaiensis]
MTALARTLLESVPAHRTARMEVLRAVDGEAVLACETPADLTNVIGSLHSSGLIALLDAAGLGAVIASGPHAEALNRIVPLGTAAALDFLAPARGRLVAACRLDEEARHALYPLWTGETHRARLSTRAEITDAAGTVVCQGTFDWSVRRTPSGEASRP